MPRVARKVIKGFPHHIIQRGARRANVFFKENDYRFYLDLLCEWSASCGLAIVAYCLMPNHVHIVAVPEHEDSLRRTFSQVHKRYAQMVNRREGCTGHLWQERFSSYVMDESYLLQAVRYVERNPVTAGMVKSAEEYAWSSAKAHIYGHDDMLLCKPQSNPLEGLVSDWKDFLSNDMPGAINRALERHSGSGKLLGSEAFVQRITQIQ
ncbi:MAG: transposase [Alphaproteobacteria bacterium]|nr:transposase [Alphaproteobacteria bacterium]